MSIACIYSGSASAYLPWRKCEFARLSRSSKLSGAALKLSDCLLAARASPYSSRSARISLPWRKYWITGFFRSIAFRKAIRDVMTSERTIVTIIEANRESLEGTEKYVFAKIMIVAKQTRKQVDNL